MNFSINVFFQVLLTVIAALCYFNGWVQIGTVAIVGSLADIIFSGLGNISYQVTSIKSVKPIFDKYADLHPEDIEDAHMMGNTFYEVHSLGLMYDQDCIFEGISFTIKPHDKCLISGLSGSGKSSLVKILLGYNKNFTGEVLYKGAKINHVSSKTIAEEVVYLSQHSYVFNGTIRDNIQLGYGFTDSEIIETLSLVGFDDAESLLECQSTELSGGQKQRLALARALIRHPNVIICDEITSALDKESSLQIENILFSQEQLTVIMITHALQSDVDRFDTIVKL